MNKIASVFVSVCCLFWSCADVDDNTDIFYYVLNDTTVTISIHAVAPDTTMVFPNIAPSQRVQVGRYGIPFGEIDTKFFDTDSVLIMQGDTLLDLYLATDTTLDPHIMSMNDYIETHRTDFYVECTFALFAH